MANTDRVTGANLYVAFMGLAIGDSYRQFDVTRSISTVRKDAGSETAETYLTTLTKGNATLTFMYEGGTTTQAFLANLVVGSEGTLEWAPEGTASGMPKGQVNAIVTEIGEPHERETEITRTASFMISGTLISDPLTATY